MNFAFPPRPRSKIDPQNLQVYQDSGIWEAQWKYNGTRTVITIQPDREILLFQRQGVPLKQYNLTPEMRSSLLSLEMVAGQRYMLDGELMHSKTTTIKDTIILYDVLVAGDKYLYGTSYGYRKNLLAGICHDPKVMDAKGLGLTVNNRLWLAPTFTTDFVARFNDCLAPDDTEREGLVLKQPAGVLNNFGGKEYEVDWQIRCRKPHAGGNYRR
jgi:ATP-dependent DNA ligase